MENWLKKKSGIYKILNTISGDFYIGSTTSFSKRESIHYSLLRSNKHHSIILQNAYHKYGESSFWFQPILVCNLTDLVCYEQKFIDALLPKYNVSLTAESSLGIKRSEETKLKISKAKKGVPHKNKRKKIFFTTERRLGCARLGERHGMSILSEIDVLTIRDLLQENILYKVDIAELFGITEACVGDIRLHRSWNHIPDNRVYPNGRSKKRFEKQQRLHMSKIIKEMP